MHGPDSAAADLDFEVGARGKGSVGAEDVSEARAVEEDGEMLEELGDAIVGEGS